MSSLLLLLIICFLGFAGICLAVGSYFDRRSRNKQYQSLLEEKSTLLEHLNEGILTVDKKLYLTSINQRALSIFGLPSTAIYTHSFAKLRRTKNTELWEACHRLLYASAKTDKNTETVIENFGPMKLSLKLIVHKTPSCGHLCLILQDLSDEQKILDMGKEFIANASHELKTPVTIIKGFAETLKDLPEISEVMFESILDKIIRNCERMENLVKHLIRLTDLENSDFSTAKRQNLVILMENCIHSLLNLYPEVRIEQLTNRDELPILGISDLLELAFTNILKNAVKYSEPPMTIVVKLKGNDDSVLVQIIDQGIGIPQEDLNRIFDRFYTVDKARCRKLGGAGLGLSLVKMILEKHGGTVWATSEKGKGSTFHIKLPLSRELAKV